MNLTTHDTIEFNKILNSLNQKQHIKFPTHIGKNPTVLYTNTQIYLTDLLHLTKCIRPIRNSN